MGTVLPLPSGAAPDGRVICGLNNNNASSPKARRRPNRARSNSRLFACVRVDQFIKLRRRRGVARITLGPLRASSAKSAADSSVGLGRYAAAADAVGAGLLADRSMVTAV